MTTSLPNLNSMITSPKPKYKYDGQKYYNVTYLGEYEDDMSKTDEDYIDRLARCIVYKLYIYVVQL